MSRNPLQSVPQSPPPATGSTPPPLTQLTFHPVAQTRVADLAQAYGRRVGDRANSLAVADGSNEIQTGHVERAKEQLEQETADRHRRRTKLGKAMMAFGGTAAGAGGGALLTVGGTAAVSTLVIPIGGLVVGVGMIAYAISLD